MPTSDILGTTTVLRRPTHPSPESQVLLPPDPLPESTRIAKEFGHAVVRAESLADGRSASMRATFSALRGALMELRSDGATPPRGAVSLNLDNSLYLGVVAATASDGRFWVKIEQMIPNLDAIDEHHYWRSSNT